MRAIASTPTRILTDGTTVLDAGRNVNARQATVDAGSGFLSVQAGRDINIASGATQTAGNYSSQSSEKGLLSTTTTTTSGSWETSTSVGNNFSGGMVALGVKNDINIEGSHINPATVTESSQWASTRAAHRLPNGQGFRTEPNGGINFLDPER